MAASKQRIIFLSISRFIGALFEYNKMLQLVYNGMDLFWLCFWYCQLQCDFLSVTWGVSGWVASLGKRFCALLMFFITIGFFMMILCCFWLDRFKVCSLLDTLSCKEASAYWGNSLLVDRRRSMVCSLSVVLM